MNFFMLNLLTKLTYGPSIAVALQLIKLIADAMESADVSDVARVVYERLPVSWRAPKGPATEEEFLQTIQTGIAFFTSLRRCVNF
ncbi:MAG: hypothetical protein IPK79_11580 [Vampirovibrionales bacterium]|nr:hypothetical protein [Vampirovibrionales bacterium]